MSTDTLVQTKSDTPKKRKRSTAEADELEIDVNLPEPPSKKALRRAKKGKSAATPKAAPEDDSDLRGEDATATEARSDQDKSVEAAKPARSPHGIWIGNLAFHITPTSLRTFLCDKATLQPAQLTRIHLPVSDRPLPPYLQRKVAPGADPQSREAKQNKGFAYVDFDSPEALFQALQLTETELEGRKVLIKDAGSFAGRPEPVKKADGESGGAVDSKPRSKRIFVGNLSFETSRDDIKEHFSQAGEVEDVFLATFEDSGKCKGYGWVRFADEDMAERAVKGWVWKFDNADEEDDDDDDDDDGHDESAATPQASDKPAEDLKQKHASSSSSNSSDSEVDDAIDVSSKPSAVLPGTKAAAKANEGKKRKWWINKLQGRQLRCEYAEDATTRYKKRYGKARPEGEERPPRSFNNERRKETAPTTEGGEQGTATVVGDGPPPRPEARGGAAGGNKPDAEQRAEARRQRHKKARDARSIAPGQALASAPRNTGAIVKAQGTKTTFD